MPRLGRSSTAADGKALGAAIVTLFREKEGRGDYCVVEQYRRGARGEKEYYFAYPQDHRQMAIEYNKGEMTRRPHRPAFEIIFILDDEQRTLSIWHQGKKERIVDLQVAFAKAVLGQDIPRESPRDDRVYDLDVFLDPDFIFRPRPELGIASAEVRKIGIRVLGAEQHSINIDLGANDVWAGSLSPAQSRHGRSPKIHAEGRKDWRARDVRPRVRSNETKTAQLRAGIAEPLQLRQRQPRHSHPAHAC